MPAVTVCGLFFHTMYMQGVCGCVHVLHVCWQCISYELIAVFQLDRIMAIRMLLLRPDYNSAVFVWVDG